MVDQGEYIPDRGDLVWVNLNPTIGHEQSGRRPAVILSPRIYNEKVGLAVFCPITSQTKNYEFEVKIKGERILGVALADQIRSLHWRSRKVKKIETLPGQETEEICAKFFTLIS